MRHILKSFIITIATAYIAYSLIPTVEFGSDPKNLLYVLGGLWIISQIVGPIFSIVLLPINILTFGLMSLILNVAFVFALLNFLPGFEIGAYDFPGALIRGVVFPAISFNQISTIILIAVLITILQKTFHLIFE